MSTVVLLSGGLDSTAALFWAAHNRANVRAIGVDYQQRHARELLSAAVIADLAGVPFERVRLAFPWPPMAGDVLPGRNGILLSIAAAHAAADGGPAEVVIGACAADAAAFPDCRPEYLLAAGQALTLGLGVEVSIVAPWIDRTKAQTIEACRWFGAWHALAYSWTCYRGGEAPCGECTSCVTRAAGFYEAGETDPAK